MRPLAGPALPQKTSRRVRREVAATEATAKTWASMARRSAQKRRSLPAIDIHDLASRLAKVVREECGDSFYLISEGDRLTGERSLRVERCEPVAQCLGSHRRIVRNLVLGQRCKHAFTWKHARAFENRRRRYTVHANERRECDRELANEMVRCGLACIVRERSGLWDNRINAGRNHEAA